MAKLASGQPVPGTSAPAMEMTAPYATFWQTRFRIGRALDLKHLPDSDGTQGSPPRWDTGAATASGSATRSTIASGEAPSAFEQTIGSRGS